MIVGDLNCTLCSDEVWGSGRKNDPLAGCIKDVMLHRNFVDICPSQMGPTWDNGKNETASFGG